VPEEVVMVSVDELPLTGLGLKPTTPLKGCPEADRVTGPEKLGDRVIVTLYCLVPPALGTD
jgi:hypothetical protein